jgi:hypothetical protein
MQDAAMENNDFIVPDDFIEEAPIYSDEEPEWEDGSSSESEEFYSEYSDSEGQGSESSSDEWDDDDEIEYLSSSDDDEECYAFRDMARGVQYRRAI